MGYGTDLFPLKSPITIVKSTPKKFAAIQEISDLAVPGIKGLAKPGRIVYVQLEESSHQLCIRECKTLFCLLHQTKQCSTDKEVMEHPTKLPEFLLMGSS